MAEICNLRYPDLHVRATSFVEAPEQRSSYQLRPPVSLTNCSNVLSSQSLSIFSLLPSDIQPGKTREDFARIKFEHGIEDPKCEPSSLHHMDRMVEASQLSVNVFESDTCLWSSLILANVRAGHHKQAVDLYQKMDSINVKLEPDSYAFVAILKACSNLENKELGWKIHAYAVENGLEMDICVSTALIGMYGNCETLEIAKVVFLRLPIQDTATWYALIVSHIDRGCNDEALVLFHYMEQTDVKIDLFIYVLAIKACTNLASSKEGKQIHASVVESGLESNIPIGNSLINMYARSRSLQDVSTVFSRLPQRDVVSWNALITGFTHSGFGNKAIEMFHMMQLDGIMADSASYVSILKACSKVGDLKEGIHCHILIANGGFDLELFVSSTLLDMYIKCGSMSDAHKVFDKLPKHDSVAWGALIGGYIQHGKPGEALQSFQVMQVQGLQPSPYTIMCLLGACADVGAVEQGMWLHSLVLELMYEPDMYVTNVLIQFYTKCTNLKDAQGVFDWMPERDVVTWTELISGYAQCGAFGDAYQLYLQMQQEGVEPNHVTFCSLVKACAIVASLEEGFLIHSHIIREGLEMDMSLSNALLDMYVQCASSPDACRIFHGLQDKDTVSWSLLIRCYNQLDNTTKAFQVYEEMNTKGIRSDEATFVSILQTCSKGLALDLVHKVLVLIIDSGLECNRMVGNAIVDMHAKRGDFGNALLAFNKMPQRDIVTWNALMAGYSQHGFYQQAFSLFESLLQEGLDPNEITYVCIFKACAGTAAFNKGKRFHEQFIGKGFELDEYSASSLIQMYVSCGSLDKARMVLSRLSKEHVAPWNAMLAGYAQHNQYQLAMQCVEDFRCAGLKANEVTYMCLLSVCSHTGLVEEGCLYFKSMRESNVVVLLEHHNAMVGLLSHVGYLSEAEDLLECLHFPSNVVGWTSLLTACRRKGNVEIGERCFERVVSSKGAHEMGGAGGYCLISEVYQKAGLSRDAEHVEELRKSTRMWKKLARAFIEVEEKVHEFTVGDERHPHIDAIHAKLKSLSLPMKEAGYVPHLDPSCGHSEKLAIAFGLVSLPIGATIRVTKNLRVCDDCHQSAKLISKIELREIVIRDTYQVHQFKNGFCSCGELC